MVGANKVIEQQGTQNGKTLLHVLENKAIETPEYIAFTFYQDSPCTYAYLWRQINKVAALMIDRGLKPKGRVIIAIPNSSHFFCAFYGVQRAGATAVPVFPGSGVDRIIKLAEICSANFILITNDFDPEKRETLEQQAAQCGRIVILLVDGEQQNQKIKFPEIEPQDVSFIQFTSGSQGSPKGVQLTHANLITNIKQMISGMQITSEDIFVSWLPIYHDMGLILMTMVPLYLGIELTMLPTGLNYLKSWLSTITQKKATFTAAPDFAYRLCLIYIKNPGNYDLSTLRVALNAAEPVRASTIHRFESKFNIKNKILPAYGLAEATVGVSCWQPGKEVKIDKRGFVSVGNPFPDVEINVMNENIPAKINEIGEIYIRSKANTIGYCCNSEANNHLFDQSGFIRTGDLGYIDIDGDFFIVGRKKNIIIQGGINISAREIEEVMDQLPFTRRSAAIGIDRGSTEGEQVYVFIEVNLNRTQLKTDAILTDIAVKAVHSFHDDFGFRPGRVYLLKTGSIPMTYNGKIKYTELKNQYLNKTLKKKNRVLFPDY
jgi:acyl-CoA synthetase (AMP-forming)/AMP-acid ligase II